MPNPPATQLRLFLAVRPDTAALERLAQAITPVRGIPPAERLRWTEPDKLHLTLRFFGSVSTDSPGPIGEVCREACAAVPAFELQLRGAGAFPNARRASVLWIGASRGGDVLRELVNRIDPKLDQLGFEREAREFTPHLTLARSKRPLQLTAAIEALAALSITTPIDALHLVRSILGGSAARYEVIDTYPLARI